MSRVWPGRDPTPRVQSPDFKASQASTGSLVAGWVSRDRTLDSDDPHQRRAGLPVIQQGRDRQEARLEWWAPGSRGGHPVRPDLTVWVRRKEATVKLTGTGPEPVGDLAGRSALPHPGRGVAATAGLLLILATVTVIAADALEPEFTTMARHPHELAMSVLLRILASGASVGIAISLYPVLRTVDHALAAGARWSSGPSRP